MSDRDAILERITAVRQRIAGAGADPARVRIVAVSKGFGPGVAQTAVSAGHVDLGENYAQDLVAKASAVEPGPAGPPRWHFVGGVQRNKVTKLAPLVDLWHTVDRADLGRAIARHAPGAGVLVQVNVTGESTKGGCEPAATGPLVDELRAVDLDVRGLMTIGRLGDADASREGFARLAAIARELGLEELSMGMTDDLQEAVAEGATLVRVGTAIFGPRPRKTAGDVRH